MARNTKDIEEMLDYLNLPEMAVELDKLARSPELTNYTPIQFVRQLVQVQHVAIQNRNFNRHLDKCNVKSRKIDPDKLVTGNGRRYNDAVLSQVKTLEFAENGTNVGIYGVSGAGKTYCLKALCKLSCSLEGQPFCIDYVKLMDELVSLSHKKTDDKGRKAFERKIRRYASYSILFIDDFAITKYGQEGISALYELLKVREENECSTVFTCQYDPEEWGTKLALENGCYGLLDGIRRRLTGGFTILVEKL